MRDRPYADTFSPLLQYVLEEQIAMIIAYPPPCNYVAKILYLLFIEWMEGTQPSACRYSMMAFLQDLSWFLCRSDDRRMLRTHLTAEDVLLFCIQGAFPQFIQKVPVCPSGNVMVSPLSATNGDGPFLNSSHDVPMIQMSIS